MVIERGRPWWQGTEAGDLDEYLRAFSHGQVCAAVHARCEGCDGSVFGVSVDADNGYAERRCVRCGATHVMLDSAEAAGDADVGEAACPCGGEEFEVAVGFAERVDGELGWVFVGLRCTADGVLGIYLDWKIDYLPSRQLLELV
ncbi:hypothetical protein Kfla_5662 [Kribbella flavida DSM 17836]|uniref:Uncharacterized protein n=1 Tax=Kribbella flavida (strain DSM 17836 / JCM 10339 / NBRC 14399) TaxID=479435 RepID=D2PP72_KRIFD|nr:hypothetical protein [Kribbella flavida]ADB34668.1 hypothetical protein Kfla_5662 [Kribbella flavida DSM 17836]